MTARVTERRARGRKRLPGRPPKGSSQLSRASIVDAALEVIGEHGLHAVSMRTVAQRLRVDPKSLYTHVSSKDGLLDAVTEHILASLAMPPTTGALEDDLRSFARAFRRHALRFPEAAELVLTRPTWSLSSLAPLEATLALLIQAGLSPQHAVHAIRLIMATLIGTVLREANLGPSFGTRDAATMDQRRRALEQTGLPTIAAAAQHLVAIDPEAEFELSLGVVIAAAIHQLPTALSNIEMESRM